MLPVFHRAEAAAERQRADDGQAVWSQRCAGLRDALEAADARSAALEEQLAAAPTPAQACTPRKVHAF
jgi:hypothetical protein